MGCSHRGGREARGGETSAMAAVCFLVAISMLIWPNEAWKRGGHHLADFPAAKIVRPKILVLKKTMSL